MNTWDQLLCKIGPGSLPVTVAIGGEEGAVPSETVTPYSIRTFMTIVCLAFVVG